MLDAVIFDVDGTLIDSVDHHAEAWHKAFAQFGHMIDVKAIRSQIGKGGDQLIPVFLSEAVRDRDGRRSRPAERISLRATISGRSKASRTSGPCYDRLRQDGKVIALASSCRQDELQAYKKNGRDRGFRTDSKPPPTTPRGPNRIRTSFRRRSRGSVLPARTCVVVGDTPL